MPKGHTNNPRGRPKGVVNPATRDARKAIAAFVDKNSNRLERLLDKIEQEESAKDAFSCIMSVVEYHVPKLARIENKIGGELGITVKINYPEDKK